MNGDDAGTVVAPLRKMGLKEFVELAHFDATLALEFEVQGRVARASVSDPRSNELARGLREEHVAPDAFGFTGLWHETWRHDGLELRVLDAVFVAVVAVLVIPSPDAAQGLREARMKLSKNHTTLQRDGLV